MKLAEDPPPPSWVYFQSSGEEVTVVGSNQPWEGFQSEIDFFFFHGNRAGKVAEWGNLKRVAYRADGNTYAIMQEDTRFQGVFAPGLTGIREALAELS